MLSRQQFTKSKYRTFTNSERICWWSAERRLVNLCGIHFWFLAAVACIQIIRCEMKMFCRVAKLSGNKGLMVCKIRTKKTIARPMVRTKTAVETQHCSEQRMNQRDKTGMAEDSASRTAQRQDGWRKEVMMFAIYGSQWIHGCTCMSVWACMRYRKSNMKYK